ncbi:MAG: DUF433 domain-containing protein [Planctomycetes bacterium]|nr:DUF433 domain-containing protein [Planctomycetota bacterium]MCB9900969.1 DUF433 domain-containing protein [Planctomycetota bacterium]
MARANESCAAKKTGGFRAWCSRAPPSITRPRHEAATKAQHDANATGSRRSPLRERKDQRITVSAILRLVATGGSRDAILQEHPYLEADDIEEALSCVVWLAESPRETLASQ